MNCTIEIEQEEAGRIIAEIPDLPGVLVYGQSCEEAIARAQALAVRILADRLDHGEDVFASHDSEEIGPRMLARITKRTGLAPDDL